MLLDDPGDPRAERAILDRAEAYRLVDEARQMRLERDWAIEMASRAEKEAADHWQAELMEIKGRILPERTPDGLPQVWLLYRPEPFAPGSDDDRSIHLWVRRCDVFTSRAAAAAHLDNLLGRQIAWRPYNELFPELWIAEDRGYRWLMCPSPVDPPGGQR